MSFSSDRIKHLEFIQATISRQASHSFAVRGWSLTVSGIIYAFAAANLSPWLAIVALLPPVAFAWLDLFYLRQERIFREMYREAIQPDTSLPLFEMNPRPYHNAARYPNCSFKDTSKSMPWWILHTMTISVGVILLLVAIFQ